MQSYFPWTAIGAVHNAVYPHLNCNYCGLCAVSIRCAVQQMQNVCNKTPHTLLLSQCVSQLYCACIAEMTVGG